MFVLARKEDFFLSSLPSLKPNISSDCCTVQATSIIKHRGKGSIIDCNFIYKHNYDKFIYISDFLLCGLLTRSVI